MTRHIVGVHSDVPSHSHPRLPTISSGVCRCGAVFDYGNIVVPAEYRGMCGRCAARRGLRPADCGGAPGRRR
jgi:hypothetical protein